MHFRVKLLKERYFISTINQNGEWFVILVPYVWIMWASVKNSFSIFSLSMLLGNLKWFDAFKKQ